MSDLIDRKNAIAVLQILADKMTDEGRTVMAQAISVLRDLSSAEPEERTAKVVSDDVIITVNGYRYHYEEYLCNACKKKVFSCDSYCSHCGAKLDWSGNE